MSTCFPSEKGDNLGATARFIYGIQRIESQAMSILMTSPISFVHSFSIQPLLYSILLSSILFKLYMLTYYLSAIY